ncbi:hypothetical protein SOVF_188710 isoform B [Spinacia oleracea]|nr:hypothetical protein SOVF_188710 isoform B [Spinacia oleracea]
MKEDSLFSLFHWSSDRLCLMLVVVLLKMKCGKSQKST